MEYVEATEKIKRVVANLGHDVGVTISNDNQEYWLRISDYDAMHDVAFSVSNTKLGQIRIDLGDASEEFKYLAPKFYAILTELANTPLNERNSSPRYRIKVLPYDYNDDLSMYLVRLNGLSGFYYTFESGDELSYEQEGEYTRQDMFSREEVDALKKSKSLFSHIDLDSCLVEVKVDVDDADDDWEED